MRIYYIYLKSHTDAPDWEQEVEAENREEAVKKFDSMLHGEVDKKEINSNIDEMSLCCGASIQDDTFCRSCMEHC